MTFVTQNQTSLIDQTKHGLRGSCTGKVIIVFVFMSFLFLLFVLFFSMIIVSQQCCLSQINN